jgi:hypothetical protein
VNAYDLNSLRVLARQHHEQRLREAALERLAHELGGSAQRRQRLRLTIGFTLKPRQRTDQPRLEA